VGLVILADLLDLAAEPLIGEDFVGDFGGDGTDAPSASRADCPGRGEVGFNASTAALAASVIFSAMVVGDAGDSTSEWEMTVRWGVADLRMEVERPNIDGMAEVGLVRCVRMKLMFCHDVKAYEVRTTA